jgi:hypothetical protein
VVDTEKKREKMAPKTSASNPKVVGKELEFPSTTTTTT